MKTRLEKALNNEYANELSFENIDKSIQLAKEIKIYDLIDANGKTINKVAEIINRLQNAEFELLDINIKDFMYE
jgi:hypothetical protein|tara:strand:- start:10479 stop:10700 length:222 start_codon:yes stop_codon:yes gene_type:complete